MVVLEVEYNIICQILDYFSNHGNRNSAASNKRLIPRSMKPLLFLSFPGYRTAARKRKEQNKEAAVSWK